jgi:hypothetical protein
MIELEIGKEIWLWATKSPEPVLLQHALQKCGKCQVAQSDRDAPDVVRSRQCASASGNLMGTSLLLVEW